MKIIIVGNGIGGSTAALTIRKYSDHDVTMISHESDYPYSRTALMYIYMGHVRYQDTKLYEDEYWNKNKIQLVQARVINIDITSKSIRLDTGKDLPYDKLILATGSQSNTFDWPGVRLNGVQGLYHLEDLKSMDEKSKDLKRAVIVGGGLIGIEMAEMFHSRKIEVTYLVREDDFWNHVLPDKESDMINKEIYDHHIDLRLSTELKEIVGDDSGNVKGVLTSKGDHIECQFVGITVGVHPNIDLVKNIDEIKTNKGIVVDKFLKTSVDDIYAIGDCAELSSPNPNRKSVEPMWYTGKLMGKTVAETICHKPISYDPGIWYNSAKFFDIEYQVYGDIPANSVSDISTLFWRHGDRKHSIRINYNTNTQAVSGFNLLGIRYRHEVCEKWIKNKTDIETVLQQLSLANFDPEFFIEYEQKLLDQYNQLSNKSIHLKSKRSLSMVNKFLNSLSSFNK